MSETQIKNLTNERDIRIEKVKKLRENGINPYLDKCERTHTIIEARNLNLDVKNVSIAGRLMLKRSFGKLIFATIEDMTDKIQIALNRKNLDNEKFKFFEKMIDIGDFIFIIGDTYKTEKGEFTINVTEFKLLSKAIRPLPEKFHGLIDIEAKSRQRYLDLIMNRSTKERFIKRSKLITEIRNFLNSNDFIEVETPILQVNPSGAIAKPFKTHHNALDLDMYLRIAPETYLKRCIAGGLEKVYDLGKCFRNEGMDPSHLQEFTMLEYYVAYWNYIDNMKFTEKFIKHLLQEINGSFVLTYNNKKIDFSGEWPKYNFRDLILKYSDIDIDKYLTKDELINVIKNKKIQLDVDFNKISRANLIDQLYKKVVRPFIINPTFLIHHPIELSPLARKNDNNSELTDRFQLVVNGWEIVNAYSELIDPIDQRERFIQQSIEREKGDEEAMISDEDFLLCMEYGMPPVSGWGMGIDRFFALISDQDNLREVVLFPIMKPIDSKEKDFIDEYIDNKIYEEKEDKDINYKKNNISEKKESKVLPPLDIENLGVDYQTLEEIFKQKITRENLINHSIATGAIMQGFAKKFNLNQNNYYYIGLLHDIDLEEIVDDMTIHGLIAGALLKNLGMNEKAVEAIISHNAENNGSKRLTFLDFALTCAESLTGLISATAKVYPDKKVSSVKVNSVIKRMKEKAFASNVNRRNIMLCEKIGLSLQEFITIGIESMKEVADRIGL